MNVRDVDIELQLLNAAGQPMGLGRSAGDHLSQIIKFIGFEQGERWGNQPTFGDPGLTLAFGFMFESAFDSIFSRYMQYQRQVEQQGEICSDGIYMTPDGFNVADGYVEEYKATWRSMKKWNVDFADHFWHWLIQVQGYCHGLGTNKARIIAFFTQGSYKFGDPVEGGPRIRMREFEFTDAELKGNWQRVLAARERMHEAAKGAA